jgi:hypothetical protein
MVRQGVDCTLVCSTNLNRTPLASPSNEQLLKSRSLSLLFDQVHYSRLFPSSRKPAPLVITSLYLDRTAFMQYHYTQAKATNRSMTAQICASRIVTVLISSHHIWSTKSNSLLTIFTFHIYFSRRRACVNMETTP